MSVANLQRHGLEVHGVESWRERYAGTSRLWHDRSSTRMPEAEVEIGSVKTRLRLPYLAGCSLAFQPNTVGILETLASKRVRSPAELPPTRAGLYVDRTGARCTPAFRPSITFT
jgi:cyclopropane-fatty-acyl-phospholipid synthase